MLKESDNILLRRKPSWMLQTRTLSVTRTAESSIDTDTMANATPPITPPSPTPLAMLSATTTSSSTSASPTAKAMAASFLASVAAAAAANNENTIPPPAVTCAPVSVNGSNSASEVLDHYSLRWNNHQNHIMHAFDALLQSKALIDVTLVCRERSIHAHKMVLSACSPFFQRVFTENPCKHPVIVLKDFRGWVVQAIVDFMYRGEISVPQGRLHTLMQAGESLQIRGLIESTTKEQISRQVMQSPDDYDRLLDTSQFSSPDLERNRGYESYTPTMVSSPPKLMLPSHFFRSTHRCERESKRLILDQSDEQQNIIGTDGDYDATEGENETEAQRSEISGIHSDICTSPMPRRKQARPRRRSGDFQLSPIPAPPGSVQSLRAPTPVSPTEKAENEQQLLQLDKDETKTLETLKTVIKTELVEPMDEDEMQNEHLDKSRQDAAAADADSGNGNDSTENIISQDISNLSNRLSNHLRTSHINAQDKMDDEDEPPDDNDSDVNEGYPAEVIMCDATLNTTEGPEDLCTTKKDNENPNNTDTGGDNIITNNNNINQNNIRSGKQTMNNNNNCIENEFLNKSFVTSMPNTNMMLNSFTTSSLRDLRLDRSHLRNSSTNADHNQHKMDVLEAQMQAAAAAVAANCENPFKHIEHQVDLSLAAAAAAVSQHHSREREREREQAMHREQRELQQQHNMYASNLLSQMGMPGMPNFGTGSNGGQHDRLDENINRLNKDFDPNSPLNIPNHFNMSEGPQNPSSPLPFPGMSSALALTPPHSKFLT